MYTNFISLGFFCGPAVSLEINGFRDFSGPFDWCVSDYQGVIKHIETRFEDFLKFENLRFIENDPACIFEDIKYGIIYNHEIGIGYSPDLRYQHIAEKYQRRCNRFMEKIKQKTCFIRAIKDEDEITYINDNYERINQLFKEFNKENTVIYLLSEELKDNNIQFPYFAVDRCIMEPNDSKQFFERNPEVLAFVENNADLKRVVSNLKHVHEKEIVKLNSRYDVMNRLLSYMLDNPVINSQNTGESLIIYGCGNIGRKVYEMLRECYEIPCFIDELAWDEFYNNLPILKLEDEERVGKYARTSKFVVTPVYEFESIRKRICDIYQIPSENIISIIDFFDISMV